MALNQKSKKFLGISRNVVWMGVVSMMNDLSSDMIFPFIPLFLTGTLGASNTFVGLVEGVADMSASLMRVGSGWLSDQWKKRKSLIVFGYSLSAIAKPFLALALFPWHVLSLRIVDRIGKGVRESPRDALISFSTDRKTLGRAFGFHRAMDTLGAAFGPLLAMLVLPFIGYNYRTLFMISFVMSFFAVIVIINFVREVPAPTEKIVEKKEMSFSKPSHQSWIEVLGLPFILFLGVATLGSLGRVSEAFLILRAKEAGVAILLIPLLYFTANISFAVLSTPLGILADKIGKRNTFAIGLFVLALLYLGFGFTTQVGTLWLLFAGYGLYLGLTEGVGRAIVAGFIKPEIRATAYGLYNACTGIALLPASLVFGYLSDRFNSQVAFLYGASILFLAAALFVTLNHLVNHRTPVATVPELPEEH